MTELGSMHVQKQKIHTAAPTVVLGALPSSLPGVLRSPGRPSEASAGTFLESRLGHDFSRVPVRSSMKATDPAPVDRADTASHTRVRLIPQRIRFGEEDPIHAPLLESYRRSAGLPPGGVDEFGNPVGPSDAELKYSGALVGMGPRLAQPAQASQATASRARWLPSVINRRNAAEVYFNSTILINPPGGLTTQFINGAEIHSNLDVENAIPRPAVQTRTEGGTTYAWFSQGIDVTGNTRMDIFSPGPWDFVISRAQAAAKYSWNAACVSGTGDATIHVDGQPSDAALETYIRDGEAEHDADTQQAFNNTIVQYVANVNRSVGDTPATRVSGANLVQANLALDARENRGLLTDFARQLNAATALRHSGNRHSASMSSNISPNCTRISARMSAGNLSSPVTPPSTP